MLGSSGRMLGRWGVMLGRETSAEGRREGPASGIEGRALAPRCGPTEGRPCGLPNDGRVIASEPVDGVSPGIAGRRLS